MKQFQSSYRSIFGTITSNHEEGRTNLLGLVCDNGVIGRRGAGANQKTDETDCMTMEPTKLHGRRGGGGHIEDLKKQIAHCLDKELDLLAAERSERAERLGLPSLVKRPPREH
jgi:hypothetical protein